jgi:hypothetical protein
MLISPLVFYIMPLLNEASLGNAEGGSERVFTELGKQVDAAAL